MFLIDSSTALVTWDHVVSAFTGATALSLLAHALNTCPTPGNKWGQWALGIAKFAVGQRIGAANAFAGQDTVVAAVPRGMGTGPGSASDVASKKVEITPDTIKTSDERVIKTETVIPNPNPPPEK